MLRLLKIEWNKIYYYKTTRIFTIIYFGMLVAFGVILSVIKPKIGGVSLNIAKLGMFNFPEIWQNIAYLVAIGKIFIAVILITNVTNEYSNGTLKQNLIDGLSKKEFIFSKLLTNLSFALLSTFFVFGITMALGLYFSENKENLMKGIEYLAAYFFKLNLFFSLCLFLSILLRKTAFAFLGLFVLWMLEGLITTVEVIVKNVLLGDGLENINPYDFYITNYLPLNASSKLIDFPQLKFEGFVLGGSVFEYTAVDWSFVWVSLVYSFLFLFLSYWLLKRRDL